MNACLPFAGCCAEPIAAAAQRLQPALQLQRTGQGFRLGQSDTPSLLAGLLARCEQQYPQARPDYWPTRVWRQLIWQPVYLSVVAVHGFSALAPMQGLLQGMSLSGVSGYRWQRSPVQVGDERLALSLTANGLSAFQDELLVQLQTLVRASAANCRGLVADTLFFALQALAPQLHQDDHWIAAQGQRWCIAMQLVDRKARPLSQWCVRSGQLVRRSCCKSFLVGEQVYCESCPLSKN
ncbi:hypothetical protein [Simiduia agarivorans]|uniref:Ferric siderophore reductase C-terminal domain-containing protein n=1 Tax=Simiduia agarivorans (strain DSM 21679 / JCM 13881 / BCRC 17597 / SA1) TaxID=1117647 RepID=K4KX14_SIMAS|nr:hypothetical protein [Simiduia agarivorans]AFU98482.1 hypothetical protein M5M_06435 [Simiduia agarivorans SA1 = DSM 21679]